MTVSYSTMEVAQRLGVSLQTVQRWVDSGRLRAWKTPGGHRRIDAGSAEALFSARHEGLAPGAPVTGLLAVVVDDDAVDRELLVHLVQGALPGARVVAAEDGFAGLLKIGRLRPALVVTDVQMPHMDGLEMIRRLRADAEACPSVLVAVSAHRTDDLATSGALPPGVPLLRKPVDRIRFEPLVAVLR